MSKPLTIDELKALPVGEWIWVEYDEYRLDGGCVRICSIDNECLIIQNTIPSTTYLFSDYGTKWFAYKNKEQAENTQMTNAEKQMILYLINAGGADLCQKCIHLNKPTCGRYISPTDYSGECSDDYCIDGMLQYFERESEKQK